MIIKNEGKAENYQLWAGAAVSDWENASAPVFLTDMTKGNPPDSLSDTLQYGKWKVIPYETMNGYQGNMIWAAPEANAPEFSIDLGVKGWYAIFVGLFSAPEASTLAWIRLDRDVAPVPRVNENSIYCGNTEEVFFKAAELYENSSLHFSQQSTGLISACGITHIKLIPLSKDEVDTFQKDFSDLSKKTMAATFDGFSSIFYRSPRTSSGWLSNIEILRQTDIKTLIFHSPGADKVIYSSKIGHLKGSHLKLWPRTGDRHFVESINEMYSKGINAYKLLIDGAHEMGIKVHAGLRPAGWSIYEPFAEYWESPFYRDNPHWRCKDRDGTPVARMSFAVPEVRMHLVQLLEEQVTLGADGAHIAFNRGYPLVLFEEPALEIFINKYGEDPRNICESDPRILEWRADIVTMFIEEIRAMLDRIQQTLHREKRLELSIMVLGNEKDNTQFGVDVRRLSKQGLVDEVFSYKWDFGANSIMYDYQYFHNACSNNGVSCKFSTASYFAKDYYTKELISEFIDNNVDGIAIWDADATDIFRWSIISRLGHMEETKWRMENIDIEKPPRTILGFHRLGEQIRDGRYPPYWGG